MYYLIMSISYVAPIYDTCALNTPAPVTCCCYLHDQMQEMEELCYGPIDLVGKHGNSV